MLRGAGHNIGTEKPLRKKLNVMNTNPPNSYLLRQLAISGASSPSRVLAAVACLVLLLSGGAVRAATVNVEVANGDLIFDPSDVTIQPGDTVKWTWRSSDHSVTSNANLFDSGVHNSGFTFSFTFPNAGKFDYFCVIHGMMKGSVT